MHARRRARSASSACWPTGRRRRSPRPASRGCSSAAWPTSAARPSCCATRTTSSRRSWPPPGPAWRLPRSTSRQRSPGRPSRSLSIRRRATRRRATRRRRSRRRTRPPGPRRRRPRRERARRRKHSRPALAPRGTWANLYAMLQADPFAEAQRRLRQDSQAAALSERPEDGRLMENVLYFARTLRAAGLPVGTGRLLAALEAVRAVGLDRRDDFYWALHAALVHRRDQQEVFD